MKILKLAVVVALTSFGLAGCATTQGSSPKGLELPIEKTALKFAADLKEGGYKTISTDELKKWIDSGKSLTIVSALPAVDDMTLGTLPGAVNGAMPKTEKELTPEDKERLLHAVGFDKEKPVVVYCGFVACRRSHIGARILSESGFRNVYRFPGGITAWQEAGYPVVKAN